MTTSPEVADYVSLFSVARGCGVAAHNARYHYDLGRLGITPVLFGGRRLVPARKADEVARRLTELAPALSSVSDD